MTNVNQGKNDNVLACSERSTSKLGLLFVFGEGRGLNSAKTGVIYP